LTSNAISTKNLGAVFQISALNGIVHQNSRILPLSPDPGGCWIDGFKMPSTKGYFFATFLGAILGAFEGKSTPKLFKIP